MWKKRGDYYSAQTRRTIYKCVCVWTWTNCISLIFRCCFLSMYVLNKSQLRSNKQTRLAFNTLFSINISLLWCTQAFVTQFRTVLMIQSSSSERFVLMMIMVMIYVSTANCWWVTGCWTVFGWGFFYFILFIFTPKIHLMWMKNKIRCVTITTWIQATEWRDEKCIHE